MIWGSDFDYEDYGREGNGIVGAYSCNSPDCAVSDVNIFTD